MVVLVITLDILVLFVEAIVAVERGSGGIVTVCGVVVVVFHFNG